MKSSRKKSTKKEKPGEEGNPISKKSCSRRQEQRKQDDIIKCQKQMTGPPLCAPYWLSVRSFWRTHLVGCCGSLPISHLHFLSSAWDDTWKKRSQLDIERGLSLNPRIGREGKNVDGVCGEPRRCRRLRKGTSLMAQFQRQGS